jgi:elongation factor P
MFYNVSDLKKGLKIEIDNIPWTIIEIFFHKPGKGQPVYRCKLKNLINGSIVDKVYRSSDKGISKAEVIERKMYYLYRNGDNFIFSDAEDYTEYSINKDIINKLYYFLIEDMLCNIVLFNGNPLEIIIPNFVDMKIIETGSSFKGDSVNNNYKLAIVEGGYELLVPLFININNVIKIDTRTGKYLERIKK